MAELVLHVPEGWRLVSLANYASAGHWTAYVVREAPLLTDWGWDIVHCTWCYSLGKGESPQSAIDASVEQGTAELEALRVRENELPPSRRAPAKGISTSTKITEETRSLLDLLDL